MTELADVHLGTTAGEISRRAIERYGDREALVCGDVRLTYRQLGARISQIMQALQARGLGRGMALCQLGSNRPETLMVRLACTLLGIRYTALHPLGAVEDHAFIIEDSEADALAVDPHYAERGAALAARAPGLRHAFSVGPSNIGDDLLARADSFEPSKLWDEADPAGIVGLVYTGGTTGRPKGVIHRHRATVNAILMMLAEWEWPRDIRTLVVTPLSHAGGSMVAPSFVKGGTVHLQEGFDPDRFLDCVVRERISVTWLVPTMLYRLLDHPRIRELDLSSLKLVVYGASPMSPTRLKEALGIFGPVFLQLYAQSELPMTVTTLNTWDHDPNHPERLASCGFPVANVQVKLLDEDDVEVPQGEVGEICVRSPLAMDGYWKRPEETAATLRSGWLHTGDMARKDEEGYLYIVDRKKDMIISGGFNVYPKEIEDVLTHHPGVAQAAVIGVPDDKWGEAVTAVIVRKNGATVTAEELIALVKEKKGSVQAPKRIEFADSIPVTAIGKPDKKVLRARFWGETARQVN